MYPTRPPSFKKVGAHQLQYGSYQITIWGSGQITSLASSLHKHGHKHTGVALMRTVMPPRVSGKDVQVFWKENYKRRRTCRFGTYWVDPYTRVSLLSPHLTPAIPAAVHRGLIWAWYLTDPHHFSPRVVLFPNRTLVTALHWQRLVKSYKELTWSLGSNPAVSLN